MGVIACVLLLFAGFKYLSTRDLVVLNSQGLIANQERDLIFISFGLCMIVVIPVFIMLGWFAYKYRDGNKKADYQPDWDHNRLAETTWWLVPFIIISILSVITWQSSHKLDPFKPIDSNVRPLKVQVIALDWKWLFIYPQEEVATINFLQIPTNTPVDFEITSDAPMNSFWIPQLGGQIYAMSGMSTQLHLMANAGGDYKGSSANISGRGFAGMNFTARASSPEAYEHWLQVVRQSDQALDQAEYQKLLQPSQNDHVRYYSAAATGLYDSVVHKFMPYASNNMHAHFVESN